MLVELEEYDETLDELEFVESCLSLLKTTTVAERTLIFEYRKAVGPCPEQYSFAPYVSERSKELAASRLKKMDEVDLTSYNQVDRLYIM